MHFLFHSGHDVYSGAVFCYKKHAEIGLICEINILVAYYSQFIVSDLQSDFFKILVHRWTSCFGGNEEK